MQTLLRCLHSPCTIAICMHQYLCTCQQTPSTGCRWAALLLHLQWLLQPYPSNVHYSDPNFLHGTSILISIPNSLIQGSLKKKQKKKHHIITYTLTTKTTQSVCIQALRPQIPPLDLHSVSLHFKHAL